MSSWQATSYNFKFNFRFQQTEWFPVSPCTPLVARPSLAACVPKIIADRPHQAAKKEQRSLIGSHAEVGSFVRPGQHAFVLFVRSLRLLAESSRSRHDVFTRFVRLQADISGRRRNTPQDTAAN